MAEIVIHGDWGNDFSLIRPILDAGHSVRLAPAVREVIDVSDALTSNRAEVADTFSNATRLTAARRHVFVRGALVPLDREDVLTVEAGVLAQTVVHRDGAEVLLGLLGPCGFLIGHGPDGCGLRLRAQTAVTVVVQAWNAAAREPDFPARVTARLRQMEAWAAMQARPSLDQRLLGLLTLLSEPFGAPRGDDTLVDVRITHAQLASAIGATRTTVTRLLGELRGRGLLDVANHRGEERFVLPRPNLGGHEQSIRHDAA